MNSLLTFLTIGLLSTGFGAANASTGHNATAAERRQFSAVGYLEQEIFPSALGTIEFTNKHLEKLYRQNSPQGLSTFFPMGSATLVSKQLVLTAGHVVKDYLNSESRLQQVPIRFHSADPSIPALRVKRVVGSGHYDGVTRKEDWALLELEAPIQNVTPIAIASAQSYSGANAYTSLGFPVAADESATQMGGRTLVISICTQVPTDEARKVEGLRIMKDVIFTDCDLSTGNSGGPLLIHTEQGKVLVAAVNIAVYQSLTSTLTKGRLGTSIGVALPAPVLYQALTH